ncbi:hypothetical protein HFP15_00230 [Amycolatopsis sp. K13G38]|uniref:Uncharacterized protein n=1 Tax=Amycolatopsis acididurans TaxID=2724524 RepID=A0ABX1IV32_9PSEU|nr:hypothetical protein [Amycolatopsis acididurans]NKQ51306.1 hypothetical protein [Amycolatopsis acididurans]
MSVTAIPTTGRLADLSALAVRDRRAALAALDTLFAHGVPPRGLRGRTTGTFVALDARPPLGRLVRALSRRWMPWRGKVFEPDTGGGHDLLVRPLPELARFQTRIEPGVADPDTDVLVADYAPVRSNPAPLRRIRDELVELAPGQCLGKVFVRAGAGYRFLGYFTLRTPEA